MKIETKKATDYVTSALTDETQSLLNTNNIIPNETAKINEKGKNSLETLSLSEIYDTIFTPKTQIIEGMLQTGAYLFAGTPKIGKSFFVAQIGYCVSKGISLWGYKTHKGTVLYLALEDDYQRIQKRLTAMFGDEDNDDFHFAICAKNLNEGLEQQLTGFITKNPDTKLIMIDTLQKIRENGDDSYSYSNDSDVISKIKLFSEKYNICILIVHHTRKGKSKDPFEDISGTNGLLGAADGAFVMRKNDGSDGTATIDIEGRDISRRKLNVSFDESNFIWTLDSVEDGLKESKPNPLCVKIAELVNEENPKWKGTSSELIVRLELGDVPANVLTRRLNVSVDELFNNYNITLKYKRTHMDRLIILARV